MRDTVPRILFVWFPISSNTSLFYLLQGDPRSQKEAAWAITNYTSGGSTEQIVHLVQMGVLPYLCKLLDSHDAKLLLVLMDALYNILKVNRVGQDAYISCNKSICVGETGSLPQLNSVTLHIRKKRLCLCGDATPTELGSGTSPIERNASCCYLDLVV